METKKRALGRGLEQLFNSDNLDLQTIEQQIYDTASNEEIIEVNLNELRPNPYQPRKVFKDEALEELSASIKEHGVFQPIIIKKSIKGYEIIAGERRVRASKKAGLEKIPAIVRAFTDEQMMEIALLENLQRENLNIIEEAIAKKVGKSRSHITNILGLLRLPSEIQELIEENKITMGHARVLSKLEDETQIKELAQKIVNNNLPVRELEKLAEASNFERKIKIERKKREVNKDLKYVEDLLSDKLDSKVKVKENKIEITYTNTADLNRILEIMNIKED